VDPPGTPALRHAPARHPDPPLLIACTPVERIDDLGSLRALLSIVAVSRHLSTEEKPQRARELLALMQPTLLERPSESRALSFAETFGRCRQEPPVFAIQRTTLTNRLSILGRDAGIAFPSRQKIFEPIPVVIGDHMALHDRPSLANVVLESGQSLIQLRRLLSTRPRWSDAGRKK